MSFLCQGDQKSSKKAGAGEGTLTRIFKMVRKYGKSWQVDKKLNELYIVHECVWANMAGRYGTNKNSRFISSLL